MPKKTEMGLRLRGEIPFPGGEGSALRGVRPPGNALFCQDGGDAPVWERPASGLNAQIIGRLDLPAHGQQQREANQRNGDPHDVGHLVGHAEAHALLKADIYGTYSVMKQAGTEAIQWNLPRCSK